MADKIVQLIDKDGDNIYPVAGSLAQGSVTTSSINDGAVTTDKLSLSYSATEQGTGTTWIDGNAIYKKTVDLGALPSNTTVRNIAHNVANLDTVTKLEAIAINNVGSTLPLPYVGVSDDSSAFIRITANRTTIVVQCGEDRSSYHGYATIYYTKTT